VLGQGQQIRLDQPLMLGAIAVQQIVIDKLQIPQNQFVGLNPIDALGETVSEGKPLEFAEVKSLIQLPALDKLERVSHCRGAPWLLVAGTKEPPNC
jgi:hypothetical protein